MSVHSKLLAVQAELKAPKGQTNDFGHYRYRSCEDILEAVKPILAKNEATVIVSDDVVLVADRYYIKATATFTDLKSGKSVSASAYARESKEKKGMDDSQITGSASSYARKYALNGLFLIDDTKDADTNENRTESENKAKKAAKDETKAPHRKDTPAEAKLNDEMRSNVDPDLLPDPTRTPEYRAERIKAKIAEKKQDEAKLMANAKVKDWTELTDARFVSLMGWLDKK